VAVTTSKTVTIDVTFRVTANLDDLARHIGRTPSEGFEEIALVEHIRNPIEDPCFDTPAEIRFERFTGLVS
jgi:hypothetical protein